MEMPSVCPFCDELHDFGTCPVCQECRQPACRNCIKDGLCPNCQFTEITCCMQAIGLPKGDCSTCGAYIAGELQR